MFKVPGWSIPIEKLKTQKAVKGLGTTANAQDDIGDVGGEKKSKKRKRGHAGRGVEVTEENLGELWIKYFEGKVIGEEEANGGVINNGVHEGGEKRRKNSPVKNDGQIIHINNDVKARESLKGGKSGEMTETESTNDRAVGIPITKDDISVEGNPLASTGPQNDDDEGRAKYERRKAKAERKREQRAQKQATGELPPPRPAGPNGDGSTNKVSGKKAKRVAESTASNQSNGFEVSQNRSLATGQYDTTMSTISTTSPKPAPPPPTATTTPATNAKLTPLQTKMAAKLTSARFRHLNETLYTTPSSAALSLFTGNPAAYAAYHAGFRAQVAVWPANPIDSFIEEVKLRGAVKGRGRFNQGSQAKAFRAQKQGRGGGNNAQQMAADGGSTDAAGPDLIPLPRTNGICTIADLGCGDATRAGSLSDRSSISGDKIGTTTKSKPPSPPLRERLKLDILSFDLSRGDGPYKDLITVADTTNLRLTTEPNSSPGVADSSVDIAICSLSLMGTNWVGVVDECRRIVRAGGEVWVAEIRSRFRRKGEAVMINNKRAGTVETDDDASPDLAQKKKKKQQKKQQQQRRGKAQSSNDADDAFALDEDNNDINKNSLTNPSSSSSSSSSETDLTPFITVWQKRNFSLISPPDLGNKMFVTMKFIKHGVGAANRGEQLEKGGGEGKEGRFVTSRAQIGMQMQMQMQAGGKVKKKFIDKEVVEEGKGGEGIDEEGRVLKPCVYKTR